jgi:hypothetical protein
VVSLTKTLFNKKLSLMVSDNFFKNEIIYTNGNDDRISNINTISIRAAVKLSKHHRFNVKLYIKDSKAETSSITPFTERKGEIGYVYTF